MRFFSSFSASLMVLALGGTAFAASGPRTLLEVGSFSPAQKPLASVKGAEPGALDASARSILAERAPWSQGLSLGPSREATLRDGRRIVKMPQMHQGVPVLHRGATVSFDGAGVARIVAARLAEDLPADVVPALSAEDVVEKASRSAGLDMNAKTAKLVIWPSGGGNVLAWHFYAPGLTIPYAPVVVVDAQTGDIVARYNAAVSVHQASVFPTNPVKSPDVQPVTLGLPDGETKLSGPLVVARNCIDMKTTKTLMGFITVHTCELLQTSVADPGSLDFTDAPAEDTAPEDPFAELHMYAHTEIAYKFFRTFRADFKVQEGPIDAVANLRLPQGLATFDLQKMADPNLPLEPFQNAFFSPADPANPFGQLFGITGGAMMFGQGPIKDYAYDGDVVYHEFTHAVVNATIQLVGTPHRDAFGIVMSPGGMNEGLSDYFSSAITGDPDVGEYAILDADPSSKAIRSLAAADACPTSIAGQVHQDATLFSAGLWDVRTALSEEQRPELDLAVFAAMEAAPSGDLHYHDMAALILAEVKTSPLGDAVATQLEAAFTARGVLPHCQRILEFTGDTMQGPLKAGLGSGGALGVWFAPSVPAANVGQNSLGWVPGVIQVRVPIPENTESLTVDFDGASISTGLGGGGGAFAPRVLVRFGEDPVQFTYGPFKATDDLVVLTPDGGGQQGLNAYNTTATVPAGVKTAYVMIANSGEGDGAFTNLTFTTMQSSGNGGAGGMGGMGGMGPGAGGTGGTGANPAGPDVNTDAGCGCAVPGTSSVPAGASLAAFAAIAGLLARRRRAGR
ncbi:M36 family metallopeptidase [Polyangium spumosum]|uniref:FTP domain-containing protein n=1 Tax=Polyangium spumosum TaxID=889282 RepID=A0A6N7Q1S7_9BACT|nr:M36 family metallopeptidase [Polyangium spumosum]MRG97667.1 hypothetical protein [Polyangium spumosum]